MAGKETGRQAEVAVGGRGRDGEGSSFRDGGGGPRRRGTRQAETHVDGASLLKIDRPVLQLVWACAISTEDQASSLLACMVLYNHRGSLDRFPSRVLVTQPLATEKPPGRPKASPPRLALTDADERRAGGPDVGHIMQRA